MALAKGGGGSVNLQQQRGGGTNHFQKFKFVEFKPENGRGRST